MISIIHKPHKINPNSNLNNWVISTDNPSLVYFLIKVHEGDFNSIIAKKKIFLRPNSNQVQFNLTDVLSNLCESILMTSEDLITVSNLPSYKLEITEYVRSFDGKIREGTTFYSTDYQFIFESKEGLIDFVGYDSDRYNINSNPNKKARFLSNDQEVKRITTSQKEYLKIFNIDKISTKMLVQIYDTDGDFLESVTIGISNNTEFPVLTINVTPSVILNHPSISADTKSIAGQYKVTLLNVTDVEVSQSRLYIMYTDNCSYKSTNIIYKNIMGGFDSVKFLNRIETININKNYLNTANSDGITIGTSGKYLNNKDLISADVTTSYVAYSESLNDYESKQIKELLFSDKVYVVVGEFLVEITVDNKTYKVSQRHVNGGKKNRLELQFTTPFSIEKLDEILSIDDIPLNNNPDPSYYLTINGDFVVDDQGRYITLKY